MRMIDGFLLELEDYKRKGYLVKTNIEKLDDFSQSHGYGYVKSEKGDVVWMGGSVEFYR